MKAAIYCRLSEEDRDKKNETDYSNSIQNQITLLTAFVEEREWEIYDIFCDDDYTGADRNRPEFKRLLNDAEAGKFDVVVCKTQSRFTRELELVEKYLHGLFPIWGIRFIGVLDNADTDNKGNKKSRQINGLVNEWFLEDLSDNIKGVLKNKRENGYFTGAFAPYGYKKDTEQKGHLIIDEEAAQVVKEIFSLYLEGYGRTAIARMLNNRGVVNPTGYKLEHGERYKRPAGKAGTLWKYFSISNILTNPVYKGDLVQGRQKSESYKTKRTVSVPKDSWCIVKNTHEPIIDIGTWNKAQRILSERTKPFIVGTVGLFANKAVCANCGYVMSTNTTRGKKYLRCNTRHIADGACIGSFISMDKLEKMVLNELHSICDKYFDDEAVAARIKLSTDIKSRRNRVLREIDSNKKSLEQCSISLKDLYMDKVKGLISASDFMTISSEIKKEQSRWESAIEKGEQLLEQIDMESENEEDRMSIVKKYKNIDHLTRSLVVSLIDHVEVGKRTPGTQKVPIKIHWNF